jgi:hypothetical protein
LIRVQVVLHLLVSFTLVKTSTMCPINLTFSFAPHSGSRQRDGQDNISLHWHKPVRERWSVHSEVLAGGNFLGRRTPEDR